MELDVTLMKKISTALSELGDISQARVYDKSVVLEKIKILNKDLESINTIRKELLDKFRAEERALTENLQHQNYVADTLTTELERYVAEIKTSPEGPTTEFLDEEKQAELMKSMEIDADKMDEVLGNYIFRKISSQRKRWIRRVHILFYTRYFSVSVLKLLIGVLIGFKLEKLAENNSRIPEYIITILIALFLFFTLDKLLDKVYNNIFWKRVKTHTVLLFLHYNQYLDHIKKLLQDKKNKSNRSH